MENNQIKSPMENYYKKNYKKKVESIMSSSNNNVFNINDLFNKNNIKPKSDFKFRTSKNSPLYTKRRIDANDEINSNELLMGGRIKNNNNEDLFSKKIKKLYKKSGGNFSQLHNNSSNLMYNNSSIVANKFTKTKKLFYNKYNSSNFDYNVKLNQYIVNSSAEKNTNLNSYSGNININNLGLMKHLNNKETKTITNTLFKKISKNKQIKHQSMAKMKKMANINYLYNHNHKNSNIQKYLKKYNENNSSGVNLINKKLNKILSPNDYKNSFLDYNKLSKTAYVSKNNSGKNSLEKKNLKNNYNIYCFNSKLIQRNDDKSIKYKNNESSRVLYDSMNNKKIKTNVNEISSSNNKSSSKYNHNYSQIYMLDSNKNNALIKNEENNARISEKNIPIIESEKDKDISLYNYINSTKKNFGHIKSTSDISSKGSKMVSSNNITKMTNLANHDNLNLNNISNSNNTTNLLENNYNTNKTNDNKPIHFRSNSNLGSNNNSDMIYKKKISVKQKDKHKSAKSSSQIERIGKDNNSKQDSIKAKLIKNIMPFSNYQSPLEKSHKKIINNYMLDGKKIKEAKQNKGADLENDNYHENKSTSLINNNYYIGINLDKKIINNICHTFRENNSYFNCNLISNNNNQQDSSNKNDNYIILNDLKNKNTDLKNEFNLKEGEKEIRRKSYKHYNSQELINESNKDLNLKNYNSNKLITIEINKKDYHKKKLLDKKISIKEKNRNDDNDMLYIPPDKELKHDTIHLTTTTSIDCCYYKNEKEKLGKYIKRYYEENGSYPETQKNFYLYGRQIGHGAFGKVNIALHVASGRLVAIKTFNKKNLKKKNAKQKIKNEIEMLSRLRHPFISQILDSFETETHIFIVMEYICGDLLGFIRKRGKLSETVSKIIFKQLIEGLKYIHKRKIVHRDIKLDNILIDLTNTIKICDFGVSRKISPDEIMHEHCGTPAYIAPEIFENLGYYGFQCDIWSAGVTLYYILSGIQPFRANSIKDLEKKVIIGDFEPLEEVSNEANDLIKLMLKTDPSKRISEDKILNHPWLANIKTEMREKLNLFTDAEKILLSKFDVNYLTSDKEELIENFTMKNLETNENEIINNAVGGTKSVIYAPYNTYIEANEDKSKYKSDIEIAKIYKEIKVNNDICKYGFKVQQANIKYELSNNQDFDNGIIKTQKDEDLKQENEKIEKNDFIKNNLYDANNKDKSPNDSYEKEYVYKVNEQILNDIEKTVGYDKKYLLDCLKKNIINYATATYYLLARENSLSNKK